MTFRPWTLGDVFYIASLWHSLFQEPWTYQMVLESFRSDRFCGVLAEEDDAIVGYACGTVLFEEAETDIVAVRENYRRQGIGKKLLSRLEEEAKKRGAERMSLEVRVSNLPAIRLYLNGGYFGARVRPKYYGDGEDALIMEKTLP